MSSSKTCIIIGGYNLHFRCGSYLRPNRKHDFWILLELTFTLKISVVTNSWPFKGQLLQQVDHKLNDYNLSRIYTWRCLNTSTLQITVTVTRVCGSVILLGKPLFSIFPVSNQRCPAGGHRWVNSFSCTARSGAPHKFCILWRSWHQAPSNVGKCSKIFFKLLLDYR